MIAPDTTVAALLAEYPSLEEHLVSAAPAMARLKNPVLRAAVAESATLAKVAEMGGIDACDLVKQLRAAAGVPEVTGWSVPGAPDWVDENRIRFDIDAGAMLESGIHPIGKVRDSAAQLGSGEVLRLVSPFRPDPLHEAMRRTGMEVWCGEVSPGRFATFMRPQS
jgi:hypothetical protein